MKPSSPKAPKAVKRMNILVTGALGFFGINLVRVLAGQAGVQLTASDLRPPSPRQVAFLQPVAATVHFATLDIQDRVAIRQLIDQRQISHIVHAAALTPSTAQEQQQITQIIDVNLGGTVNLFDAAIHCGAVERVLLVSSSGLYGAAPVAAGQTQAEEGPLVVDSLYTVTKRSAELIMQQYSRLSGIAMAAARLGPLYGPLEQSSASRPQTSGVGQLMQALQQQQPVQVAGPTVARDWTYMVDAAAAVQALLQTPTLNHDIYNVSCGIAVSWQAVVEAFVSHGLIATWTTDVDAADIAMRPHQARSPMDITRLQQDTPFRPRYGLAAGVATYIAQETSLA